MHNRGIWLGLAMAAALILTGCKSSKTRGTNVPNTPSGLPEVIIQSNDPQRILAVGRDFFLARGYAERSSRHAHEVIFDKPYKEGSRKRGLRVRLRVWPLADGTCRMAGAPMGVEDWRTELESERFVPQGMEQIQEFLKLIKVQVELGADKT